MISADSFSKEIDRLASELGQNDLVLILGRTDTGKTTFVREAYAEIGGEIIDADLGQPRIGPPGLISIGNYERGMSDAYFVGDFTPRGNLVQVMTGVAKTLRYAEERKRCFIDTDGWIEGEAAEVYKRELIDLVDPDQLVLLEEARELEKFTSYIAEENVLRVHAKHDGEKTTGERSANRTRKFKYYFSKAKRTKKGWEEVRFGGTLLGQGEELPSGKLGEHLNANPIKAWKTGDQLTVLVSGSRQVRKDELQRELEIDKLNLHSVEDLRYRLVGCYDGQVFTGMGTITEITGSGVEIMTPSEEFDLVKFGQKKVEPSGRTIS